MVIIVMLAFVRLSLKSDIVLNYARNQIEIQASNQLNGNLTIESISGDLLRNLTINGIRLHDKDDNLVIEIDSIFTSFQIWAILRSEIKIDEFFIYDPQILAIENDDETWNLMGLSPSTSEVDEAIPSSLIYIVESLTISGGQIDIISRKLPDSLLIISELNIGAGFRIGHEYYALQLNQFEMNLSEGRLSEDISIGAGASINDGIFTLDKLTLNTGASLFEAYLNYNSNDEEIDFNAILNPLSWTDILAYSDEPVILQDVRISVGISGNISDFTMDLIIDAIGMRDVEIEIAGGYTSSLILSKVNIQTDLLDLPLLTGDDLFPVVGQLKFNSDGQIQINDYPKTSITGKLTLSGIKYQGFTLDDLTSDFELSDSRLKIDLNFGLNNERISSQLLAKEIFANPIWSLSLKTNGINPAKWLNDDEFNGLIRFAVEANGIGLQPRSELWSVYSNIYGGQLFGQPFRSLEMDIELTDSIIDGKLSLTLVEDSIEAEINVLNWMQELPKYTFSLFARSFDLTDVNAIEDFPTSLNFKATGRGSGFDISKVYLESNIVIEESTINGAELDRFQAMIFLDKEVINFKETFLRSTFAEGNLTLRQHLFNSDDILNRVDFDLELLDLQPLAPLVGLEFLMANGKVNGTIRTARGSPEVQLIGSLHEIIVDSIRISTVEIMANIRGLESSEFEMDTRINDLVIGKYPLDDIWFRTAGEHIEGTILGNYRLDLELDKQLDFTMQSHYKIEGDSLRLETSYLRLLDGDHQYNLATDFVLTVSTGLFATTPILLRGSNGVELAIQIEQYKESGFRGSLNATDVNLEMLQRLAIDDVYVLGKMSGKLNFDFDTEDEKYNLDSDIKFIDIDHQGFLVDEAHFQSNIIDDRLSTTLLVTRKNEEFISFQANVPFKPGDPLDFDDAFFKQPVEGFFKMNPLNLAEEHEYLSSFGFENTAGIIEAKGSLSGVAGNPDISGSFKLDNGRISDVSVDSVRFNWNYDHSKENVTMTSQVVSLGQQVAVIEGFYPLLIDWKTFNIIEPEQDQGISLFVTTNDLDLTAFNQFLDQSITRQLRGRLNAELSIRGNIITPEVNGFIRLRQGAINVVPNNLNVRSIEANIELLENAIMVRNISAQSLGNLSANGEIKLDGYNPQHVKLSINARNFQISNTRDVQAILSFNTQLDGNTSTPKLTGSLTLDRGYIYLDNFGERTVEEVRLDEEQVSLLEDLDFWNNLTMEMKISTSRNFWVRNRSRPEIQLELNGELDLVKSRYREVEVFGRMGVKDGYVTQLGKRFTFDQGDLVFSGNPANPALGIRTLYTLRQPSDVKIWYVIGGTAETPTFSYESDPEMELQDIVSYTVFGRPFHALMAWEQSVAGRSDALVADAALDILLDRVEQLATQRLGIDLLQIDNTRTGGSSATTIKAGKFISEKLFVALFQEFGTYMNSQVIVEYQLKRDLNLILTGSDSYHTGIDVLWKYDY
jgi:hypothetical protein